MARNIGVSLPGYNPQAYQPKESTMDKILKGVQIANSVLGTVQGVQQTLGTDSRSKQMEAQTNLLRTQEAEQQRKTQGIINPLEAAQMGLMRKGAGGKPSLSIPTQTSEGVKEMSYMKPEPQMSPIEQEQLMKLRTDRTFVPDKEKLDLLEKVKVTSDFSDILKEARNFQGYVGPQMRLVPDFMKQFVVSPKFASFTAKMDTAFFQFRKKITGAQAAMKELADLKQTFPNAFDRMEYLIAKADTWKKDAQKEILNNIEANATRGRVFGYTDQMLDILYAKAQDPDTSKRERKAFTTVLEANNYQPKEDTLEIPSLLAGKTMSNEEKLNKALASKKSKTPLEELGGVENSTPSNLNASTGFDPTSFLGKYGK